MTIPKDSRRFHINGGILINLISCADSYPSPKDACLTSVCSWGKPRFPPNLLPLGGTVTLRSAKWGFQVPPGIMTHPTVSRFFDCRSLEFKIVLPKFHRFGKPVTTDAPSAHLGFCERVARSLVISTAVQRKPCSHGFAWPEEMFKPIDILA